jgi:hypothetical protein
MSNKTEAGPVAQLETLLDAYIEQDPDAAQRLIESHLARVALKQRLQAHRAAHPPAQEQPTPYFNRAAVERAISSAENPAPGTMQLNDGKERVTLPSGTLRRMLAIIDQLGATRPTPAAQEQPAPAVGWTGNADADLALMLLDRLDVTGEDFARVDQLESLVRKLAATHPTPAERAEQPSSSGFKTFLALAEKAGIKTIHDIPGLIPALQATERAEQPPRDAVQQGLRDEQIDRAVTAWFTTHAGIVDGDEGYRVRMRAALATLKGQP